MSKARSFSGFDNLNQACLFEVKKQGITFILKPDCAVLITSQT